MNIFNKIGEKIGDTFGGLYHAVTGTPSAKEQRATMRGINEQINLYKQQTELATQELRAKQDQATAEKRRIEEKQIRALRRNFRPAGFLDMGSTLQDKLGA